MKFNHDKTEEKTLFTANYDEETGELEVNSRVHLIMSEDADYFYESYAPHYGRRKTRLLGKKWYFTTKAEAVRDLINNAEKNVVEREARLEEAKAYVARLREAASKLEL